MGTKKNYIKNTKRLSKNKAKDFPGILVEDNLKQPKEKHLWKKIAVAAWCIGRNLNFFFT